MRKTRKRYMNKMTKQSLNMFLFSLRYILIAWTTHAVDVLARDASSTINQKYLIYCSDIIDCSFQRGRSVRAKSLGTRLLYHTPNDWLKLSFNCFLWPVVLMTIIIPNIQIYQVCTSNLFLRIGLYHKSAAVSLDVFSYFGVSTGRVCITQYQGG